MSSDKKLLTEWTAFSYTPEMVKESRDRNGGKVIMKGILQKAETLNQNGRVYPLSILEREVRNYQKFIRENRALGECVPPGTEILTLTGWKKIENIDDNEVIATCNLSTGETEYQAINQKIEIQFSGKLHKIHNHSTYSMIVTPNHNHVLWDRKNVPYKISSIDLLDITRGTDKTKKSWISHSVFKQAFTNLKGEDSVHMHTSNAISSDLRFMKIDEIEYDGPVYCVNVKNGTWLMRQNERVVWTGNCDHPDSSVVELKKVSHIIREAWMEGNVCYGTVEILDTPMGKILQSLVESGVTLGISSRGVGSTKRDGDSQVVQDDFQLICWDFVAEPSTPGAFMMAEGKRVSENDLKKTFTRSDRIDRVFNEVLSWRKSDKR